MKAGSINIVLLGPPGVGKGTQSKKLLQAYPLTHIAPGDLLREEISQNTALGQRASQYIDEGKLAPNTLIIDLVKAQLEKYNVDQGFLFDGYPRTTTQAAQLDRQLAAHHMHLDKAILLEAPEVALIQRIKSRALLEGRADDQDDTKITTRMRIYHQETAPIADYYARQQKLIRINGLGDVDTVFERLVTSLA